MTAEASSEISVVLPDGSRRTLPAGSTGAVLAGAIGRRLARDAVAVEVDGQLADLGAPLHDGAAVRVVTAANEEGRHVLRHSTAHVMAQAVLSLWPGARFAIGPPIADGFYYDFELPGGAHFSEEDLPRIEARMREIVAEDQPFVREEHTIEEGLSLFGDQPYKREIIEGVRAAAGGAAVDAELAGEAASGAAEVSTYRNTEQFVDLCRGPHVPSTARLGYFKLMRVAGAYWRGDERRPQLQRIYGTAWESAEALEEHLHRLEEAERRDHRKLGLELDLFSFPEEIGSGLAVFHPKGGLVRRLMEDYSRQRHDEAGYQFVNTPHITKAELFELSGHLQWFAEGMFPPMELDGGQKYYLKPMNCPFHILVYRSRQRSYRELPMRLFEFGTVYRYEKSGVIHGLTRVRGLTMDDAHIFCTRDQMAGELDSLLTFVLDLLRDYGLDDFFLELSTRPEGKAVGSDEEWEEATEALRRAAQARALDLVLDEGGGAFYGPKISVQARDAIGRTWQMSTIQLDFQFPQRFELSYIGADNGRHRPVMIHRALFGSVERFFGMLLEHYAGAFPTWLAPVQVRVLPVRDTHEDYARSVAAELRGAGLRVDVDEASEPLGARVRRGKLEKIPYLLVVGDEDVAHETVGVNARGSNAAVRGVPVGAFAGRVVAEVATRSSPESGASQVASEGPA
ncbi:MAG TPA: threonine--tRNA ligase [Acidimicrobiales bacterium]|nr:threonine--tRNA ligase [Acidimicrobiales bacterium]